MHVGEREGGGRGEVWRSLRGGGVCRLRGCGATQSATCCTVCKVDRVGIGGERFGNVGRALGWHTGRGYTGGRRGPTLVDVLPSEHPFSCLMRRAGKRWACSAPTHKGNPTH